LLKFYAFFAINIRYPNCLTDFLFFLRIMFRVNCFKEVVFSVPFVAASLWLVCPSFALDQLKPDQSTVGKISTKTEPERSVKQAPLLAKRTSAGTPHSRELVAGKRNKPSEVPVRSQNTEGVKLPDDDSFDLLSRDPLDLLPLRNIKPLYTAPRLPREGVWDTSFMPRDQTGRPIIYRTFYRPSVEFPNAVVHMMVVDMDKVRIRYYVGSQEPGARKAVSRVETELRPHLVAVTNAMWMQKHSRGAGAIFRGRVLYPMVDGMATLIVFKNGRVDILEWNSRMSTRNIQDARQLRHLIVKDGMVVRTIRVKGRTEDAEIGLGFLLGRGEKNVDGRRFWFAAHRSAFGIREDGNLVFAVGHHVSTKDLAKALVLAGCQRAIHGDANPSNIVGNLYLRDPKGHFLTKVRLSPEQSGYTLKRYEDGYTKDFFGFFYKDAAGTRYSRRAGKRRR
jgi:hypothetical protein